MTYVGKQIREVRSPGESDDAQVHVTMVTGELHNEQPGDLEAEEGVFLQYNAVHVMVLYCVSLQSTRFGTVFILQ